MSFFGVGPIELIIVLLVAFIFLGPERMIDAARLLGRLTREVRRMTAEVREMVDIDELTNPRPKDQEKKVEVNDPVVPDISPPEPIDDETGQTAATPEVTAESDGPISFKSARQLHREKMEEQEAQRDASQQQQEERS